MFKKVLWILLLIPSIAFSAERESDQPKKNVLEGFVTVDGYYDSRDMTMFTFRTLIELPHNFQYFSLLNLFTDVATDQNGDFNTYYTEQNLLWKLPNKLPLGLNMQAVSTTGKGNDLLRFGFRWDPSNTPWLEKFFKAIHLWYVVYFHMLQTDFDPSPGWGFQIEQVYRIDLFPKTFHNRVWAYGFFDKDINFGGSRQNDTLSLVYENQINCRLIDHLSLTMQVRHEEFLPEKTGFGPGLEYEFDF